MLNLDKFQVDYAAATAFFTAYYLQELRSAARVNRYGFRSSGPYLLDNQGIRNEMEWMLSHFYISGLDKANNNACFIYIRHIRLQALQRLMGPDFEPCKTSNNSLWMLPVAVFDSVWTDLLNLLPEAPLAFIALPFLMATFKQHKQK